MSPPTCLFLINGLGLGNSTRSHAVIEHLAQAGCEVHVLTSGNGLTYFDGKTCIKSLTPMESFFYSTSERGISAWSTLKSIWRLAGIARAKKAQLEKLLEKVRPNVAVIDSEYAVAPFRRRRIPVIGLNTSEMVVTEYLKCREVPPDTRGQFWLIEFSDYLFHRRYCDLVLSPYPLRASARHPKFRRIGLIIRSALAERIPHLSAEALAKADHASPATFPSPHQFRRLVFMLSGSVHASDIPLRGQEFPFKIDVIGRTGESQGNVTYHGRQMDNIGFLTQADALVINAGYSAVSEAFALRKPTFVVPVPGHAEQFVNARLVSELGLGFIASEADVLARVMGVYHEDHWTGLKPMPPVFELNGAREAAALIMQRMQGLVPGTPAAIAAACN